MHEPDSHQLRTSSAILLELGHHLGITVTTCQSSLLPPTPQVQADLLVVSELVGILIPEVHIDTSTCTWRKQKVHDVGNLSQCLCGLAITAAQMGNKAI
jgi:hypothetical protein